jgi:hypothetical protein
MVYKIIQFLSYSSSSICSCNQLINFLVVAISVAKCIRHKASLRRHRNNLRRYHDDRRFDFVSTKSFAQFVLKISVSVYIVRCDKRFLVSRAMTSHGGALASGSIETFTDGNRLFTCCCQLTATHLVHDGVTAGSTLNESQHKDLKVFITVGC